jgi:hypothetical protein
MNIVGIRITAQTSQQLTEQAQPELTGQRRHHRPAVPTSSTALARGRRHQMFLYRQRLSRLDQGQEQRIPR